MQYWLVKTEPTSYGIDHLKADKRTAWSGVRNYQARNFMRDDMRVGDLVFIYHSNVSDPGIHGVGKVCSRAYPDATQFDKKSQYFDPKASKGKPRWFLVDICFVKKFKNPIPISRMRNEPQLSGMPLLAVGSRLSVQPVSKKHRDFLIGEVS